MKKVDEMKKNYKNVTFHVTYLSKETQEVEYLPMLETHCGDEKRSVVTVKVHQYLLDAECLSLTLAKCLPQELTIFADTRNAYEKCKAEKCDLRDPKFVWGAKYIEYVNVRKTKVGELTLPLTTKSLNMKDVYGDVVTTGCKLENLSVTGTYTGKTLTLFNVIWISKRMSLVLSKNREILQLKK
ncbi:hypothetical protein EIN_258350 [Entamoeba invadens IP1]|uniref:Uncharacterized protein n=1 Tax=Entamoeba invadens IP1 TaxID=370355 RepID=A0A0A1TV72_ENTIV|nr:hypothetical protein EIN_258350 [Entamoeba invadens IP1]ELP84191.1 hypothetical protein EIN_258350 [Entamoeba invadens IP1]|eukprot:XP_004183537.1 hypothetical protein EIN_258350 [Entamoeba invadens IP1]